MFTQRFWVCVNDLQELHRKKFIKQFVQSDSRDTHDIWAVQGPLVQAQGSGISSASARKGHVL